MYTACVKVNVICIEISKHFRYGVCINPEWWVEILIGFLSVHYLCKSECSMYRNFNALHVKVNVDRNFKALQVVVN